MKKTLYMDEIAGYTPGKPKSMLVLERTPNGVYVEGKTCKVFLTNFIIAKIAGMCVECNIGETKRVW
jgi:hypothetical protein